MYPRFLGRAAPGTRARAAADEHERIRLALLVCADCGKIHQPHPATAQAGNGKPFTYQSRADPDDGHIYRARWTTGHRSLDDLIGDQPS